jgi:hypothetical protein
MNVAVKRTHKNGIDEDKSGKKKKQLGKSKNLIEHIPVTRSRK